MNEREWRNGLGVGDEVMVCNTAGAGLGAFYKEMITRATKTVVFVRSQCFSRSHGYEPGFKYHGGHIEPVDGEVLTEFAERVESSKLRNSIHDFLPKASVQQLRNAAAALQESPK